MKTWLVSAICLLLLSCGHLHFDPVTDGAGEDAEGRGGLLARYRMDDIPVGILAAEPPRFAAPCLPCPTVATAHLVGTGGFHFSGDAGKVRVPLPVSPWVGNTYSVAMWLRPTLSQGTVGASSALSKTLTQPTEQNPYSLIVQVERGGVSFPVFRFEGTTNSNDPEASFVNDQSWHHVVTTQQGDQRRLFVDGIFRSAVIEFKQDSIELFGLGCDINKNITNLCYDGDMDDLRFYNVALSDAEVAALFVER
jgi:Concanavalin A-like lectin/glucanases superfamily